MRSGRDYANSRAGRYPASQIKKVSFAERRGCGRFSHLDPKQYPAGGDHPAYRLVGGCSSFHPIEKEEIVTKYLFDYHFHHHISHETIRNLRSDSLMEVKPNTPDYFIDMHTDPTVSGFDTSTEFRRLKAILCKNYSIPVSKQNYTIYKRVPFPEGQAEPEISLKSRKLYAE